jgi:hypothetical protein
MSMLANFVMLVQLSVCQKQQEVIPYDEYDIDEENGGEDHGGKYTVSKIRRVYWRSSRW